MDAQAISTIVTAAATIVTAAATTVLARITWNYARHTKVMSDAMARQIVPDIVISEATVELEYDRTRNTNVGWMVRCRFRALVSNRNSASGSVVEPQLFARFQDGSEVQAGSDRRSCQIFHLTGGQVVAADLWYEFLFRFSEPNANVRPIQLDEPETRFRISCMDNLGIDCGKNVPVTPVSENAEPT